MTQCVYSGCIAGDWIDGKRACIHCQRIMVTADPLTNTYKNTMERDRLAHLAELLKTYQGVYGCLGGHESEPGFPPCPVCQALEGSQ